MERVYTCLYMSIPFHPFAVEVTLGLVNGHWTILGDEDLGIRTGTSGAQRCGMAESLGATPDD